MIINKTLNENNSMTYYTETSEYNVQTTPEHYIISYNDEVVETLEVLLADTSKYPADVAKAIYAQKNKKRLVNTLNELDNARLNEA